MRVDPVIFKCACQWCDSAHLALASGVAAALNIQLPESVTILH